MNHVRQPRNSNLCGQTSTAMVIGVSLEESIGLFGSRGKTATRQLVAVLRSRGFVVPDRLVRFTSFDEIPTLCLLHSVSVRRSRGYPDWKHWMVWAEGRVWDPLGNPAGDPPSLYATSSMVRVTSYLPVTRPADLATG